MYWLLNKIIIMAWDFFCWFFSFITTFFCFFKINFRMFSLDTSYLLLNQLCHNNITLTFYCIYGFWWWRLESSGPSYCWNELITLTTKYRDLTAQSQLTFTVSCNFSLQAYLYVLQIVMAQDSFCVHLL